MTTKITSRKKLEEQIQKLRNEYATYAAQRRIRDANRRFVADTPAKQRVAIAKDVIKQIDAGVFRPEAGVYIHLGGSRAATYNNIVKSESCNVCALGSMFCSAIKAGMTDLAQTRGTLYSSDTMRSALSPYFSEEQLHLIEDAFEQNVCLSGDVNAESFGMDYDDDEERLRAIMQNIIENKGEFIP